MYADSASVPCFGHNKTINNEFAFTKCLFMAREKYAVHAVRLVKGKFLSPVYTTKTLIPYQSWLSLVQPCVPTAMGMGTRIQRLKKN